MASKDNGLIREVDFDMMWEQAIMPDLASSIKGLAWPSDGPTMTGLGLHTLLQIVLVNRCRTILWLVPDFAFLLDGSEGQKCRLEQ